MKFSDVCKIVKMMPNDIEMCVVVS